VTDYRIVLAQRGTPGLGTVLVNNVQNLGSDAGGSSAFRWTKTLNGAGSLEFSLPIDASGVTPANFYPGRELHLYRNPGSGEVLVWAGHLWTLEVNAPWVRCMGLGWWETFRHRQIRSDFYRKQYEQVDTAWEILQYSQGLANGDIGISRSGSVASGVTRTTLCCAEEADFVADVIEELSGGDDGFDFEMTPAKAWKTYYPERGTDKSGTVVLNGSTNITSLAYTIDGTQMENDIIGIGPVKECDPTHMLQYQNNASQVQYGLLQAAVQRSHLGNDTSLIDSLARQELQLRKVPRFQPAITLRSDLTSPSPLTGEFDLGDTVMVTAGWGFASFTTPFRVLAYTIDVDTVGRETVDLTLDSA
jgi:hypothetical protein